MNINPINAEVNIGNQSSGATVSVFFPVHFIADQYLTRFQNSVVFIRLNSSIILININTSHFQNKKAEDCIFLFIDLLAFAGSIVLRLNQNISEQST